jgi:membrane-associated phospholipid phosphatase
MTIGISRWMTLFFVAATVAPESGESQASLGEIGSDFKWAFADIWHVWTSPLRASPREWLIGAAAAGAIAGISAADDEIDAWVVRNPEDFSIRAVRPFRQDRDGILSEFGSGRFLLPASGALYLIGVIADNRALRDAGIGCAAAHQAETIPRGLSYRAVSRRRPSTANGDQYDISFPGGEWEVHSFFGGHLANALACATVWSTRFKLGPLEPLMYSAAVAVGFGRIVDRKHWTSDIITGAVIAYPMARSIAKRQLRRLEGDDRAEASGLFTEPGVAGSTKIGWKTVF